MADTYPDLLFAYSVVWLIFVAFLFKLQKKQTEISKRLAELESRDS